MGLDGVFFDDWAGVWRVVLVGLLAYLGLVLALRVSGKRTLAKLNAFDLVVTVALGSTLATVLLSGGVSLAEGLVAVTVLIALQYLVAWSSVHSRVLRRVVKSEPTLLLYRGQLLVERLEANRTTAGEVRQAVRAHGIGGLSAVHAVVLETDGTLSVIASDAVGSGDALHDVALPSEGR